MKLSGLTIPRKTILAIAWAMLALSGCSATADKFPLRLRDSVLVRINVVDKMPGPDTEGVLGRAYYKRVPCDVYVLDSVYPHGVMHEIMHCFSGNWHEGVPSSEYLHIAE